MTTNEMIKVIEEGTIASQSQEDKDQIMVFAFGAEFMDEKNAEATV